MADASASKIESNTSVSDSRYQRRKVLVFEGLWRRIFWLLGIPQSEALVDPRQAFVNSIDLVKTLGNKKIAILNLHNKSASPLRIPFCPSWNSSLKLIMISPLLTP